MKFFQCYLLVETEPKITKTWVRWAGNFAAKFVRLHLRLAFMSAGTKTLKKLFVFRALVMGFPLR